METHTLTLIKGSQITDRVSEDIRRSWLNHESLLLDFGPATTGHNALKHVRKSRVSVTPEKWVFFNSLICGKEVTIAQSGAN